MATSTAQAIATVPVWDYLMAPGDPMSTNPKGLSGRRVKISLTYGLSQSAAPVTLLDTEPVGVTTDGNGFWQVNLVPNNKISPAGTLYTVEIEGYRSYVINVTDVGVPGIGWQSSAIAVLPPISGGAGYTLPGGTSVLGGLNIASGEPGFDVSSAGALLIGDNVATSIELGTLTNVPALQVLGLTGAVAASRYVGATSFGAPTTGSFSVGDFVISQATGAVIVCSAAGTPGTWLYPLGIYNVKDFGAKGDGVADDTSAIQSAINAAAVNGGKVFFPPGTYLITNQLTLNAPNVVFEGASRFATTIKRANAVNQHMFHLVSATNAMFIELSLDENGANNATTPHGIWMDQNSANVLVERCKFLNCDGFAVYVFSSNPPVRVTNLRIIDSDFVQLSTGTHDLVTVMSNGGAVIGNRFTIGGVNAGLCLYELNDVPCTNNVFIGQGTGAKLVQIASVLGCTFVANTILCGANDICIWLICENDNANNRNCIDTVIQGNTIRNSGANTNGSTGIFVNGGTQTNKTIQNTIIADNIFDSVGLPIYYYGGTVIGVELVGNDFTGSNTPTINRNVIPTAEMVGPNRGYNPHIRQAPAFAASYTPDLSLGDQIAPGVLTANMTINNFSAAQLQTAQVVTFIFTQDGTGGRTLIWNAAFKTAWQPAPSANAISAISFIYDGTYWQQIGGQLAVDQTGKASAVAQLYPGAEALGAQVAGGILHSTGVPNNANGNNNDWCVSDNGRLYFKVAATWVTPSATLKKGSGGGNYVSASTTYVDVDATNLALTITIPTNWKLVVNASGQLTSATAIATVSVSLLDGATLVEANVNPTVAGTAGAEDWALNWVINGDGAAHTVKLQYKTSNGADSATMLNSSATLLPTMVFTLMPSG